MMDMDSQQKNVPGENVEEPPELTPPDAELVAPRRSSLMLLLLVAFFIFILLDLAILAYFFFPGDTDNKQQAPASQATQHAVDTAEMSRQPVTKSGRDDLRARQAAEGLRDQWLQLQAEAEADGIENWGGKPFADVNETVAAAERSMAARKYDEAAGKYHKAIVGLQSLRESRPKMRAKALAAGGQALNQGDGPAAAVFFNRALALDPDNEAARRGLERAKNMDQVQALYKKALTMEQQGDLKAAEQALVHCQKIDSLFQPVSRALFRVRNGLAEQEFKAAMAAFLRNLAAKRTTAARASLLQAERLRPQSSVVAEGKEQLHQLVIEQSLARLADKYRQAVASEDWARAGDICRQALKIDAQAAFAQEGLLQAGKRLALDSAMQAIIDKPLRLQAKAVEKQARQTLAAARSIPAPGAKLSAQIASVTDVLAVSSRPVPVVLQSDNATEIIIYRVGRMGRFSQKTVRLKPGRYTIVGTRQGYRDVRREVEVRADSKPPLLHIRCTEVI